MANIIARELIVDNFKSFGKKTTIPFLDGFTTISGPNGSGKSNLLDSILFALGLSTSKGMRAERLPDLINSRSNKKECRVTLKLWIPDENRELSISRSVRLTKTGYTSNYYLDDKSVNLQEVHDALAELNVSPKGYNVVMQGDVTRLLSMSATDRRKIIDEMAGVAEFDERIDSARKELDQADSHMDNTRILFTELTHRLVELETEKKAAQAYLGLRSEAERLDRGIQLRAYADLGKMLDQSRKKTATAQAEHAKSLEDVKASEADLENERKVFKELDARIQEISENDRMGGFAELEEIRGNIARSKTYSEYVRGLADENRGRADELKKKSDDMQSKLVKVEEVVKEDSVRQRELETLLAGRRLEVDRIHDKLKSMTTESTRTLTDLPALRKKYSETRELISSLGYEDAKVAQQLLAHKEELERAGKAKVDLETEVAKQKSQLEKRTLRQKEVGKRVAELSYGLFDHRALIKGSKQRLYELEEAYRNKYREYTRLEERTNASQETFGGGALEAVLNSGLKGLHGRVIDLVEIPEAYRLALESAAGKRLEHLVVTDENVATQAINFLKERRLGRLTFLPMTKIRGMGGDEPLRGAGIIGWAMDLVKFEDRYRNVISYVLGSTLVIDKVETGLPMIGRHRMVSLEGDLLEKSGAMTGGSAPQGQRRGMVSRSDLAAQKRKLEEMEQEARRLRESGPQQEEQLQALEEELTKLKREESECAADVTQLTKEVRRLGDDLQAATQTADSATKKIAQLERDQKMFRLEIDKSRVELERLEGEVGAREALLEKSKMGEISEEMRFADGQVKEQEEILSKIRDRLKEKQLEREFYQKNMALYRREVRELEDKILTLVDQAEAHDEEATKLKVREDELRVTLDHLSKELGELKEKRDAASAQVEEKVAAREGCRARQQKLERELTELAEKMVVAEAELAEVAHRLRERGIDPAEDPPKESVRDLEKTLAGVKLQMEQLGNVNLLAIEQYAELEGRLGGLREKLETLDREKRELLERMGRFQSLKKDAFLKTYEGVRQHFARIYHDLSDGEGQLVLENPDDPFAGGLVIKARPREKKLIRIEALSGGEKSLAALGFVFAFQSYRPAPFYIFDEVDMFLDNPNTERLARMIRNQAKGTQFIVVSLKKCMIESSQQTIGVFARDSGSTEAAGLDLTERTQFVNEDGSPFSPTSGNETSPGSWN